MASLSAVLAINEPATKATAFQQLLDSAATASDTNTIKAIVDSVLDETQPLMVPKTVLKHVAKAIDTHISDNSVVESIAEYALAQIRARLSSFEEADYALRMVLYRVYVGEEDFLRAANVLGQAKLEGGFLTDAERAAAFVRVAQNYIKSDDDVNAERFARKASAIVDKVGDFALSLQYKACYAQIADQKRKFLEAAVRYIDVLRLISGVAVPEEEVREILEKAAKCTILAPAGPQRQRVMGTLVRDERAGLISPIISAMLDKMYNERIISPADVTAFEATLAIHQKAVGSDKMSVVQRAIIEHNIHAASKVYSNISFSSLSAILGVDKNAAERIAAKMVKEARLSAAIDQVDEVIDFAAAGRTSATAGPGVDSLLAWDSTIKDVCAKVNDAYEAIVKAHPELAPA